MPIERRQITVEPVKSPKDNKPKVIKWKGWIKGLKEKQGIDMVRNQSFLAAIREIIDYSNEMDVVRVGIVGDMMSGKSTMSMAIGHAIHTISLIPFAVRVFYRDDLRNFKATMKKLKPANYILIFDDVSFLKNTSQIEQEVTEIRHMEGGQDVKIILIFNFHYPKALPPFLREFQFKFVTTIGTDNEKTIADNYGKNNVSLIQNFKIMRKRAITKKEWYEKFKKTALKYTWRGPFIPVLFWNESTLRKIVSPTRYFMDKVCSICDEAQGNKTYDESTIKEVLEHGERLFNKQGFLSAVKLSLFVEGHTAYSKTITKALRWLNKERKIRNMPLSVIATYYGLDETKTRVDQKSFDEAD